MGFLDALSSAVTPALQYRTGQLEGEQVKRDREEGDFLKSLALARQQAQDAMAQQLKDAQIKNYESEIHARENPQETFGDFENVIGPDGKPHSVQRGNRGTVKETPYAPIPPRDAAEHNIDPLSDAGIQAAIRRAQGIAAVRPQTGATAKVSGDERKNKAFYENAKAANEILRQQHEMTMRDKVAGSVPLVGNYFKSPEYRRMAQAAYQLSEAWLRATSGAAISENEIRRNAENYFPQPGDDDATLLQKTRARERIVRSLQEMAGRAVDPNAAPSLEANPDLPYGGVQLIRPPEE